MLFSLVYQLSGIKILLLKSWMRENGITIEHTAKSAMANENR